MQPLCGLYGFDFFERDTKERKSTSKEYSFKEKIIPRFRNEAKLLVHILVSL